MNQPTTPAPASPQGSLGVVRIQDGLWAVSSSDPANPPHLVRLGDGGLSCDAGLPDNLRCKGYMYRGWCKHCKAVSALIAPAVRCANCRAYEVSVEGEWCEGCLALELSQMPDLPVEDAVLRPVRLDSNVARTRAMALPEVPESTPEEVAEAEAMRRETMASLIEQQNLQARLGHTFVRPGATELLCSRPSPFAGIY